MSDQERWQVIWDEVGEWQTKNFPDATIEDTIDGMLEELGELCHATLKGRQGIRGMDDQEKVLAARKDAVGDMMLYLLHYMRLSGEDLDLDFKEHGLKDSTTEVHSHLADNIASYVHFTSMCDYVISNLNGYSIRFLDTTLLDIVEETWAEVKQRDWQKNPESGTSVGELKNYTGDK